MVLGDCRRRAIPERVSEGQAGWRMLCASGRALGARHGSDKTSGEDDDLDRGVRGDAERAAGVVFVRLVAVRNLEGRTHAEQQAAEDAGQEAMASTKAAQENKHGIFDYSLGIRLATRAGGVIGMFRRAACWIAVFVTLAWPGWALGQAAGQRLILKDGTYQIVTRYEVKGDRVRYQSAERGNEWEEIPYALIDWPATKDWARVHDPHAGAALGTPSSHAESDAAAVDKEAAAERQAEAARQPSVAPGLRLPDESGVWGFDTFRGTPELVRVGQSNGNLNRATGHTVLRAAIPRGGARELIQISGPRSSVQFHVAEPILYVSVDAPDNVAPDEALVVDTHGESQADRSVDKRERSDPGSHYAIVRVRVTKNMRTVAAMKLSLLGQPTSGEDIVPTRAELMPGGHWLKLTPAGPLTFGEYALVELLSSTELNLDSWDFGIDPRAPENKHPFSPLAAPEQQP